jgi:hypothetical protein
VQPTNQEFSFEARRHGWTAATAAFPGTVGVIDPAGLLEALQPLLAERGAADVRIEATEAGVRFALGGDSLEVGAPGPLAALLFGGETEEAQAAPRARGRLAERLDALLPLPLLWYGYNYV